MLKSHFYYCIPVVQQWWTRVCEWCACKIDRERCKCVLRFCCFLSPVFFYAAGGNGSGDRGSAGTHEPRKRPQVRYSIGWPDFVSFLFGLACLGSLDFIWYHRFRCLNSSFWFYATDLIGEFFLLGFMDFMEVWTCFFFYRMERIWIDSLIDGFELFDWTDLIYVSDRNGLYWVVV